jgi:L-Ala-D/L-Glu epimerase
VKLVAATIYALRIPFVEAFAHSAAERRAADSVVVRVRDEAGTDGFGEGVPRPYVTGETAELMVEHLAGDLWPEVAGRELPPLAAPADLAAVDRLIPEKSIPGVFSDNASRAALELAIVDCVLRRARRSLGEVLPPRRSKLVYSGVITAGSVERAVQHARQMKLVGLRQVKLKVGADDDLDRVRAVRDALGPDVSLRLDANGAWSLDQAVDRLTALAPFGIASVEQPLPRGPVADLRRLRERCPVPVMVDEALVTGEDARALIAERAADYFNIRVSKCGGLHRSWQLAGQATAAGLRVQVGCQVGETAILAAAGRHLAAALPELAFLEGSFGTLLLVEDVALDSVRFGHRGEAPLLAGPGLGIDVVESRLRQHSERVVEVS